MNNPNLEINKSFNSQSALMLDDELDVDVCPAIYFHNFVTSKKFIFVIFLNFDHSVITW